MKLRFISIIGLLLVGGVGATTFAYAQEEGRKIVGADEVIAGDYVAAGETVEIAGVVQGDAYVAGGQVLVSGVIEGDLLVLGGTVSISGEVKQNVRVAGWQVVMSGVAGRNVTLGALNVEIGRTAYVQGGLVVGAANIVINGPVEKSSRIAGRNLTITSTLAGDVDAAVDNIRLAPGTEIKGNFTYWSNKEASIAENVQVLGTIQKEASQGPGAQVERVTKPISQALQPLLGIVSFVTTLVIGVLVVRLLPDYSRQTVLTLRTKKWRSITNGVTTLLVIPIVFGILIITIVGIPLGFALLLLSSFILYVARVFVMLWIGMVVSEKLNKNISDTWAFILGLAVYSILAQVPLVGWAVSFLAVLFGLGAAVQTLKENYFAGKQETRP